MNALANMGANMSAMLAGTSPLTETQPDNAEGSEIGVDEMPQSMAPANPPVTDSIQDVPAKSTESAECNGGVETPLTSEQEDGAKPSTPAEVNINIDKTQVNAIYSSLLGLQNTLDNFQLDVKQDSLREVVYEAIKDAVEEHLTEGDKAELEKEEKLRAEGKPGTVLDAYQMATQRNTDAINKFNHNSDVIKKQYKNISDLLCELLGRANLCPYEKPKFKDESGHILLNSLYLYPWYCFECFYSSKRVRGFFKTVAWSVWLITLGLLFFIARDNAILQKQQNINRYVHAYFSDNAEVMMELEGIDMMFSDQKSMIMPVKEYREYIKERKNLGRFFDERSGKAERNAKELRRADHMKSTTLQTADTMGEYRSTSKGCRDEIFYRRKMGDAPI